MDFQLYVLDFDGTFTDVEKEAGPFINAYLQDIQKRFGKDILNEWNRIEEMIKKSPDEYGWVYENQIVAPANSDPYLRASVIMNIILDEQNLIKDLKERFNLLEKLYFENYPKANTVFRKEAKEVIEDLIHHHNHVVIVSNSETSAIKHKLSKLNPKGMDKLQIFGHAKKFLIEKPKEEDKRFNQLPTDMHVRNLKRPLLIKRGFYFDLLKSIWNTTKTSPESTLVCGDIFELDLILPAHLGSSIHLVQSSGTAEFEKEAALSFEKGSFGEFSEILHR